MIDFVQLCRDYGIDYRIDVQGWTNVYTHLILCYNMKYKNAMAVSFLNLCTEENRTFYGANRNVHSYEGLPARSIKGFLFILLMIGYIYKTTNLLNGKIYIGQHQKPYFDYNYFGSGKLIVYAVKKHGKENFKVEILRRCYKITSLCREEKRFIKLFDSTNRKIGYNIIINDLQHMSGWKHTPETIAKLKILNLGRTPFFTGYLYIIIERFYICFILFIFNR